jgi:hypothetical protein
MPSKAFTGLSVFYFLSVVECYLSGVGFGCWVHLSVVIVFCLLSVPGYEVLTVECRASMSVVVLVSGFPLSVDCC